MPIREIIRARRQTADPSSEYPITAAELAAQIHVDATRAGHLLAAVGALVDRFAPSAPDDIKREGIIRAAGWLADAPSGGIRSEKAGELQADYSPSMTGCLRHSGAMSLLSPWKVRRAGSIG